MSPERQGRGAGNFIGLILKANSVRSYRPSNGNAFADQAIVLEYSGF
jgi:hypothetical protein